MKNKRLNRKLHLKEKKELSKSYITPDHEVKLYDFDPVKELSEIISMGLALLIWKILKGL